MSRQEDFDKAAMDYCEDHSHCIYFEAGAEYGYQYAQTHPNWISVEDELPPKMDKWTKASGYVLVYTNEGEWLIGRYWHDGDGWSVSGFTKAKVTHWMPIIPPRKEE